MTDCPWWLLHFRITALCAWAAVPPNVLLITLFAHFVRGTRERPAVCMRGGLDTISLSVLVILLELGYELLVTRE